MEELVVNPQEKNLKIYLASKSPRRQQLLSQIGLVWKNHQKC
jgi:predicted house-cleaning NTP pyrophosphatase (Maf/HAM1 superfamily)